jgi:hypothetical protein
MRMRSCLAVVLLAALVWLPAAGEAGDPRCTLQGETGPCKAAFERYQYDPGSGTCREILWGGCGSPVPFETKAECMRVCGGAKPLVIAALTPYPDGRLPYALLSLEYPKDWEKPDFTIRVNGAEMPFRPWGGGYSPDRQFATLLFFPGAAGTIRVTVQAFAGGKSYEATDALRWNVWSMAGLLDGPGRLEAVMKARPLRFWAFPADGVRVLWNGRPLAPRLDPLSGKPVGLFSIEPEWQPGKNLLSIETTGQDGKRVTAEHSFVYLADGTTRVGEILAIPYGTPGSKSGPFYSFVMNGDSLVSVKEGEEPYFSLDPEGWAIEQAALVRSVKAERPGETRVRILVKRHFLQGQELEREFGIVVVPGVGK